MHCRYCGYPNGEEAVRCVRCDGRLQAPPVVSGRSSAVPALQSETQTIPVPVAERKPAGPARQAQLFDRGNVIAFPVRPGRRGRSAPQDAETSKTASGAQATPRAPKPERTAEATGVKKTNATLSDTILSATQERLLGIPAQQDLGFASRGAESAASKVCRSDSPVAAPAVRVKAAVIDAAAVLLGVAVSAVPFMVAGAKLPSNTLGLALCGAYVVLLALAYEVFYCVLNRESFGMSVQRVRLVNFDGEPPSVRLRWARLGSVILSTTAAGLGLIWALVDEERLAWHDHISKTYPTIDDPNPGTFRRR